VNDRSYQNIKLDSVRNLYQRFDKVFKRPSEIFNQKCCVSIKEEKYLLENDRLQIEEEAISKAFNHYHNCFGTFEQMAYFLPRLIELASENNGKLGYCISFWSQLKTDKEKYVELGLWSSIAKALEDVCGNDAEWIEFKKENE
jgi:hypothetical protein